MRKWRHVFGRHERREWVLIALFFLLVVLPPPFLIEAFVRPPAVSSL